jgi:dethiobiotin synthetase
MLRIIFITGTDTGVGKTVLTGLLLSHLRRTGRRALAIKPFCSGSRADAQLLHALQDGELTLDEINPFFFREPLAPLVAARRHRRRITLRDVLNHIERIVTSINPPIHQSTIPPPTLLIEGAGGLLAPLGDSFTALDLIAQLNCDVIIVARNQLGTINHTLLAVRAFLTLQAPRPCRTGARRRWTTLDGHFARVHALPLKIVLMNPRRPDPSAASNPRILSELVPLATLFQLRFLGQNCATPKACRAKGQKLQRILHRIIG